MKRALLAFAAVSVVAVPVFAQTSEQPRRPERRLCIEEPTTGSNMRRTSRHCKAQQEQDAAQRQAELDMDKQRSGPRGSVRETPVLNPL